MRQLICATLLAFLALSRPFAQSTPADQQTAAALWERAVAAKGGRERLAAIRSFAIYEKTVFRKPLPEFASAKVHQIVCELPDRWWEFLDYRPGKMGYSVTAANAQTGLGWSTLGGAPRPFLRRYTGLATRVRQLQYVYFLETRTVRPAPVRASRAKHRFKAVDRVETLFDDDRVVFDFDVKTHLPVRIEVTLKNTLPPPRPGMKPPGDMRFVYELSEYEEIGGIMLPTHMKLGNDAAQTRVEINPDYDAAIFITPPSPDSTIDSWRKRKSSGPEPSPALRRPSPEP